jgi:hypothetical protein
VLAPVEHPAEDASLKIESGKVRNILSGEIYTKGNSIRNGTLDLVLLLIYTFVGQKNVKKEKERTKCSNRVNDSKQNHKYKENRTE